MMAGKILPSAVDTEVDHFGGEFRQLMQLPLGRSKFEAEKPAFNPTKVAKSRLGTGTSDDERKTDVLIRSV